MRTEWPARWAGANRDILMCGHKVNGRFGCMGEIAYIGDDVASGTACLYFPSGLVRSNRPGDPPAFYRETTRFSERAPRWRRSGVDDFGRTAGWTRIDLWLPVRRNCPRCRTLAIVTWDVVSS